MCNKYEKQTVWTVIFRILWNNKHLYQLKFLLRTESKDLTNLSRKSKLSPSDPNDEISFIVILFIASAKIFINFFDTWFFLDGRFVRKIIFLLIYSQFTKSFLRNRSSNLTSKTTLFYMERGKRMKIAKGILQMYNILTETSEICPILPSIFLPNHLC